MINRGKESAMKLFNNSGNVRMTIPKKYLTELGIAFDSKVSVKLEKDRIVITKFENEN